MTAYFISDLHLGHRNITTFSSEWRGDCTTVEEHDQWIIEQWNSVVKSKRDYVYVTGDAAFNANGLKKFDQLNGKKILVMGNHDHFQIERYLEHFQSVHGLKNYRGKFWLSHAPIHPMELRGKASVHGHVHNRSIDDPRYINICVEALAGRPVSLPDLLERVDSINWLPFE